MPRVRAADKNCYPPSDGASLCTGPSGKTMPACASNHADHAVCGAPPPREPALSPFFDDSAA